AVLGRLAELPHRPVRRPRVAHPDQRPFAGSDKVLPVALQDHRRAIPAALEIHARAARIDPGLPPELLGRYVDIQAAAAVFRLQRHPVLAHPAAVVDALDETVRDQLLAAGWIHVPGSDPEVELPVFGAGAVRHWWCVALRQTQHGR